MDWVQDSPGRLNGTLFGRLDPATRKATARLGTPHKFRTGEKLLTQGDKSHHLIIILTGLVKVTALTSGGRSVLLAIRVAGDIVGDLASVDGEPRTATVTACAEVHAREVSAGAWEAYLESNPAVFRSVSRMVSGRLRAETMRRIAFNDYPAPVRIARVLAEFGRDYGHDTQRGRELPFDLSQQELAAAAECGVATVQNTLRDLRSKGLADKGYLHVVIKDLDALDRYSGVS